MTHEPLLTKEESAVLRMLASAGLMKKIIPPKTMEKLLALKFVEEKVDGLVVTEKGTEILDRYSR
jgi:ribosomal protein S19E (S16A)